MELSVDESSFPILNLLSPNNCLVGWLVSVLASVAGGLEFKFWAG